jgi:NAD(P)-dependent dehydrogenase (short-subunit alcohol dehydrogenase family)
MFKVWLITGSGNGLGRNIAAAALAAGYNVVAGARRTEELEPLVKQYGGRVKPVTLEVREEAAAKGAAPLTVDTFRRLHHSGEFRRRGQEGPVLLPVLFLVSRIVDTPVSAHLSSW